jgi:acyl carrier protein
VASEAIHAIAVPLLLCSFQLSVFGALCQTGTVPESRTAKLRSLIQEVAGKPAPADEDESLFESGLLDSFALPDLVSAIEQTFAIKVPDADLNPRKFDSIARIEAYLQGK